MKNKIQIRPKIENNFPKKKIMERYNCKKYYLCYVPIDLVVGAANVPLKKNEK